MTAKIQIQLNSTIIGDGRGFSFTAPGEALAFVGRMADVHLAATKPRSGARESLSFAAAGGDCRAAGSEVVVALG